MPSPASNADPPASVSWKLTPETSLPLRLLVDAGVAVVGGGGLLVLLSVGLVVYSLAEENLLVAVGVVGGLAALVIVRARHVLALRAIDRPRAEHRWRPSRVETLVASLAGAVVLGAMIGVSGRAVVLVAVAGLACAVIGLTLSSSGELDGETLELRDSHREASLTALSGTRRLAVGPVVAYWFSYERGTVGLGAPRLLVVPRETAAGADAVLAAAVEAPADATPLGRVERAIVAAVGLGMLFVGPALWWLVAASDGVPGGTAGRGSLVVAYAVVFSALFGGVVLWYAWTA